MRINTESQLLWASCVYFRGHSCKYFVKKQTLTLDTYIMGLRESSNATHGLEQGQEWLWGMSTSRKLNGECHQNGAKVLGAILRPSTGWKVLEHQSTSKNEGTDPEFPKCFCETIPWFSQFQTECTTPSHSQSLANFVANVHSQGISAMRTKFSQFHLQNHSHSLANSFATPNSQLFLWDLVAKIR